MDPTTTAQLFAGVDVSKDRLDVCLRWSEPERHNEEEREEGPRLGRGADPGWHGSALGPLLHTWRTLQFNREGQITERFTRAIDQLGETDDDGNPRLEIRLGGIYALERIARDSPARDYSTVMEVLTAYVRENAPWPPKTSSTRTVASNEGAEQDTGAEKTVSSKPQPPPPDIQAILDALGRRQEDRVPEKYRVTLDLRKTDLREAYLRGAVLRDVFLDKGNLQGAVLAKATLSKAVLQGANLLGANLRGVHNLTEEQIEWTIGSNVSPLQTKLPEGLNRPQLWSRSIEEQTKIVQEHLRRHL